MTSGVLSRAVIANGDFASASILATAVTGEQAADVLVLELQEFGPIDLAILIVDGQYASEYEEIVQRIQADLQPRRMAGGSGAGVIGPRVEAERTPAISLMVLRAPGGLIEPYAVTATTAAEALERIGASQATAWVIFADPFSMDGESLVKALEQVSPGRPLIGGLVSAQRQPEDTVLFCDGQVLDGGAVVIGLGGTIAVQPVVAQGAEPFGDPQTITECDRTTIKSLGFRPAIEVLKASLAGLGEKDQLRASRNLLCGLAMDEYRDEFKRGDFLVRNIMGGDPESGAIAINAVPRQGQTFQFQFRDAQAADDDLRGQLKGVELARETDEVMLGAVLCACNGRGIGMFGVPDHDAAALSDVLGPVPTAGFFCNGEIGPVGGKTFLHGFTASIALVTARP